MKFSMILAFLLSWSFVSSYPRHEESKESNKSVSVLSNTNDRESDNSSLAGKNSSDEASSGKDWGGYFLKIISQKVLEDIEKKDDADNNHNKSILLTLISEGLRAGKQFLHKTIEGIKKFIETLMTKDTSSDIPLYDNKVSNKDDDENFITWIQKNGEALIKLFIEQDHDRAMENSKECTSIDEKTEKRRRRAKRDTAAVSPKHPWDPHKGSISDHILKLSEGSTSKVLKSEKATIAESLAGRAAIDRILAKARAKSAKATQHKDLYNNDDFKKWLISGSSFDMNIFNHSFHRQSADAKTSGYSKGKNIDDSDSREFSVSHSASAEPVKHRRHHRYYRHRHRHRYPHDTKHTFRTLYDSAATDSADTEHSYTKLLHKSRHGDDLLFESRITSGEEHGRENNEMFRKPTVLSHDTHRSLSREDTADTGLQRVSSRAPRVHFHIGENDETEKNLPTWERAKWKHGAHASRSSRFTKSREFETSEEREDYNNRRKFKTTFDTELEHDDDVGDEEVRTSSKQWRYRTDHDVSANSNLDTDGLGYRDTDNKRTIIDANSREKTESGHEEYYYAIGNRDYSARNEANTENRHLTDSAVEQSSSGDLYRGESIEDRRIRRKFGGIQRPAIRSGSAEAKLKAVEEKQSDNIDIENHHSRDRNVALDAAPSFPSSLSDEKENGRSAGNTFALPSVDDASVEEKAEDRYNVLGKARATIDGDATSTEMEIGFSGIKSHSPVDLPSAVHSSRPRARWKTHLENRKVHHSISGYRRSSANSAAKIERSLDKGEGKQLGRIKNTQGTSFSTDGESNENHDANENREISADVESSAETTMSVENKRRYDSSRTWSSRNSRERDYIRTGKKNTDPKGNYRGAARRRTSIEIIDIPDRSSEVVTPKVPNPEFRGGHVRHDVNYRNYDHNYNSREIRGNDEVESDESTGDRKEIHRNGLKKERKFVADNEMTEEEWTMVMSKDRRSHNRHGENRNNDKHDRHYGKRNEYNQDSTGEFNRRGDNTTYSKVASKSTESNKRNKGLRITLERENDELNASRETTRSVTERDERQSDAMNEEISYGTREETHVTNEDNRTHLKKHTGQPIDGKKLIIKDAIGLARNTHSGEINKIASTKAHGEGEIEKAGGASDESKNRETSTRSSIYDGPIVDAASQTNSGKKISIDNNNNNNNIYQDSWKTLSENADISQTDTETVYDARGRNKNVNINKKQTTETAHSADTENNLKRISKTSSISGRTESQRNSENYSSDFKETIAKNSMQTSDETFSGSSESSKNKYRHDDLHETSVSSEFTDKSQMDTKHRVRFESWKKNDKMEKKSLGTDASSSNDVKTDEHSSGAQNTIASSESSAESKIKSEYNFNNVEDKRKHNTDVETSADAMKNASVTKSSTESEAEIEYRINDLKNTRTSTDNNQITNMSKAKEETMLSDTIKDEQRSRLQDFSSSVSAEKRRMKSHFKLLTDKLQNDQIDDTELSKKSTALNRAENKQWSDSSKSIDKIQLHNKYNSEDPIETLRNTIEHRSGTESVFPYKSHTGSTAESKHLNVTEDNRKSIFNSKALSKTINSARVEGERWYGSQDASSTSKSSAISQVKNEDNADNTKMERDIVAKSKANAISSDTVKNKYRIDNGHEAALKTKEPTYITNVNNINKFVNNKNIERDVIFENDSTDASVASDAAGTSTSSSDMKKVQNLITKSSSIDSKAEISSEYKLNRLKGRNAITDNSAMSRTRSKIEDNRKNEMLKISSQSDSHSTSIGERKHDIDTVQNSHELIENGMSESVLANSKKRSHKNFEKETGLSEAQKIARNNFNSVNNVHRDNILKDTLPSVTTYENVRTDDTHIRRDKSDLNIRNPIESESTILRNIERHKSGIVSQNIDEISNNEITFSDDKRRHEGILQKMKIVKDPNYREMISTYFKNNSRDDMLTTSATNAKNEREHELMTLIDTEARSKNDRTSNASKIKKINNSKNHNEVDDKRNKFQTIAPLFSHAETQDRKETAVRAELPTKSMANVINEDVRENKSAREKSLLISSNVENKESRSDEKIYVTDIAKSGALNSNISAIKRENDINEEIFATLRLNRHNIDVRKENKKITSNRSLLTGGISSSEMRDLQSSSGTVTTPDTHTETEHIWNVLKDNLAVTTAKTPATSSKKPESESEGQLIRDSPKINTKLKTGNDDDLNDVQKGRIKANIGTSANSAVSNDPKNNLIEENALNVLDHDTYMKNENRDVLKNNLVNAADVTASTRDKNYNVIQDEHQDGIITWLSNSNAEAGTERGHNLNVQRKTISFGDKKDLHGGKDATTIGRAESFSDVKTEHRDNISEMSSADSLFANTRNTGESDIDEKQHSIYADSRLSSHSKIFGDDYRKNYFKKLISSTDAKAEEENHIPKERRDIFDTSKSIKSANSNRHLKKMKEIESFQATSPFGFNTNDEVKNKNTKEDPDGETNEEKKESTDMKDIKWLVRQKLFELLAAATKMQTEHKIFPQKSVRENVFVKISSDFSPEAQMKNAFDTKLVVDNNDDEFATVDTTAKTKMNNQRDRRTNFYKTFPDTAQNTRRDSIDSYGAARATSEDIINSEEAKKNREVTVNASTLGKARAYDGVKDARPSDWLITRSGAGTLAEERAQNKDKFNILREVGKVAVYAETPRGATSPRNIGGERSDIHTEDPSEYRDNVNVAKKVQYVYPIRTAGLEGEGSEGILFNVMTSSPDEIETRVKNAGKNGILRDSVSFIDADGTGSITRAKPSVSASTSDNVNMGPDTKHDGINNGISDVTVISPMLKKIYLSAVTTTPLRPSHEISKCDDDVETKEFINEATNLHQMLSEQWNSEFLLMKKNPKGPVQIASIRNSISPLITYRLIPRQVYERIRTIIANKQTLCIDCPLSYT